MFRIALCQLRVSSYSLTIKLGRYAPRVPRERRYCVYCNDSVDNEYHFVLICNHHNHRRIQGGGGGSRGPDPPFFLKF